MKVQKRTLRDHLVSYYIFVSAVSRRAVSADLHIIHSNISDERSYQTYSEEFPRTARAIVFGSVCISLCMILIFLRHLFATSHLLRTCTYRNNCG